MKKILFLLLGIAFLGGYQFLRTPEGSGTSNTVTPDSSSKADLLTKNGQCSSFREKIRKELSENQSIQSLFYSPKLKVCMYEKRIRHNAGVELVLVNIFTKQTVASWSSLSSNAGDHEKYINILHGYQEQ